ncbi:alpha/beta hydrolase [Rhodococcus erythropolis]|uniref:alpha/beta hydrolase n=1 Tax=Rhodococcus erythropolis TaxID=1833 RepID=UPI00210CE5FA|nr:alpha/beta hydrolase [Rhodococcus erythropolis]MCQ4127657.1 alpha/beta hydrolase [Rhodococcus erythropolis]
MSVITATPAVSVRTFRGPGITSRVIALPLTMLVRPVIAVFGRSALAPWPFRMVDHVARILPAPRNTVRTRIALPRAAAEFLVPPTADSTSASAILYVHGGGLLVGGLNTHRLLAADIANAAGEVVLAIDYRMPPRSTVDDAVTDVLDGLRELLSRGYRAENIAVVGDSAGAFIGAVAIARAQQEHMGRVRSFVAMSPVATLTEVVRARSRRKDAMFTHAAIAAMKTRVRRAGGSIPELLDDPEALSSLPRTLIQTGEDELLSADAYALASALTEAHVSCELQSWRGQFHVFQAAAPVSAPARAAVAEIGAFLRATRP